MTETKQVMNLEIPVRNLHEGMVLPNVSKQLSQIAIDLSTVDHGYDSATTSLLNVYSLGDELSAAYEGSEPQLFNFPERTRITFYEPEIRVWNNGDSQQLVPLSATSVDNLMIEALPAAKALIFGEIGCTREMSSTAGRLNEPSLSPQARAAVEEYRQNFSSIIDHPNEGQRVNVHQGALHVGDPERLNLGRLEIAEDFPAVFEDTVHLVYISNTDNKILRRFSIGLNSSDAHVQKMPALAGYQAGFYEYSNVKMSDRAAIDDYNQRKVEQGLNLIGRNLELNPEIFDGERPEVLGSRMGQDLRHANFGTPTLAYKHQLSGVEMLARVRSPHGIYAKTQQLFIGPKGSEAVVSELATRIAEVYPSYCHHSTPEDGCPVLEVTTTGESLLLAHGISKLVFDTLQG